MTRQRLYKTVGFAILLMLVGLILTACSVANFPQPQTAGQPIAVPPTTNTGDWDAVTFFATTCASCHGPTGAGTAVAPPLNTEAIQTADPDWIIETVSNGRPGTAMPAWSREFGGPLTSDQIAEIATFVQSGEWEKAGEIAAEQPASSMGRGMMGRGMGRGMMGHGMMGRDRQP